MPRGAREAAGGSGAGTGGGQRARAAVGRAVAAARTMRGAAGAAAGEAPAPARARAASRARPGWKACGLGRELRLGGLELLGGEGGLLALVVEGERARVLRAARRRTRGARRGERGSSGWPPSSASTADSPSRRMTSAEDSSMGAAAAPRPSSPGIRDIERRRAEILGASASGVAWTAPQRRAPSRRPEWLEPSVASTAASMRSARLGRCGASAASGSASSGPRGASGRTHPRTRRSGSRAPRVAARAARRRRAGVGPRPGRAAPRAARSVGSAAAAARGPAASSLGGGQGCRLGSVGASAAASQSWAGWSRLGSGGRLEVRQRRRPLGGGRDRRPGSVGGLGAPPRARAGRSALGNGGLPSSGSVVVPGRRRGPGPRLCGSDRWARRRQLERRRLGGSSAVRDRLPDVGAGSDSPARPSGLDAGGGSGVSRREGRRPAPASGLPVARPRSRWPP